MKLIGPLRGRVTELIEELLKEPGLTQRERVAIESAARGVTKDFWRWFRDREIQCEHCGNIERNDWRTEQHEAFFDACEELKTQEKQKLQEAFAAV